MVAKPRNTITLHRIMRIGLHIFLAAAFIVGSFETVINQTSSLWIAVAVGAGEMLLFLGLFAIYARRMEGIVLAIKHENEVLLADQRKEHKAQMQQVRDSYDGQLDWWKRRQTSCDLVNGTLIQLLRDRGVLHDADREMLREKDPGISLFNAMHNLFDFEELRTIAFQLGMDWHNLEGSTSDAKLIGMIRYAERLNILHKLRQVAQGLRPSMEIA